MALTKSQEIKWAGTLQGLAQEASIIASVTDGTYAADASGAKIVRVVSVSDVSVAPYVAGQALTYADLTDSEIDIALDQKNAFTFKVEDIDAAQTGLDVKTFATQRAGKTIALTADAYAFGLHAGAGHEINDGESTPGALAVNSANVESVILDVAQYFDENNIDAMDRNLVVAPWFKNKMILAGLARSGANSDAMYLNGFIGEILGFKVYVSNQLASGHMLAMTSRAIAYAGQINKVESLRLQDAFADAVRGLMTFGAKVVKAAELVDLWVSNGAES